MALAKGWSAYDGLVKAGVTRALAGTGFNEINGPPNPINGDWVLVRSPTPLVTCILIYLFIVALGIGLAKKDKKKKQGIWLWYVVQAHNIILIMLSAYMSTRAAYLAWHNNYKFWGTAFNPADVDMAQVIFVFYVSKYLEFGDTLIMVLKGNTHQISFLHVYHHVTISLIWWSICYVAPGGDAWYSCFLNSLVHVLMYSYYFIAAALGDNVKAKKQYLWWGRYLTQFQMFQFVTMLSQAIYCWNFSPYPKFLSKLLCYYMLTLLLLFYYFYQQKYSKDQQRRSSKGNSKEE